MKATDQPKIIIRLTPAQKAWLEYNAKCNNRSQTAEMQRLVQEEMKRDPLRIRVHEYNSESDAFFDFFPEGAERFFTVSVGECADEFFETPDCEQAIKAAKDKAEALGLGPRAVMLTTGPDNCDRVVVKSFAQTPNSKKLVVIK